LGKLVERAIAAIDAKMTDAILALFEAPVFDELRQIESDAAARSKTALRKGEAG
jgi:hypothetical protein